MTGLRLGMDGYLYVSVGDKGVPGVHGTDGSFAQLRGGGVLRVRPDGSRVEVVATGTRNHLDVAMDERGNVFTYDNTDDGLGWWTRVTHVVRGGYYGYPWDYLDFPERHLPPMGDYGGGSPCGGLVYREAAWPEEYAGNLFFCEWGKGVLRRIVVEPAGSSFRIVRDEDFMRAGGVLEFRPLDVCESPDGRYLYVADWGYGGWRAEDRTGRLWRVRRTVEPVGSGALPPLPPSADARIAELDASGFNRRLRAQRALSATGSLVVRPLADFLARSSSARARRHALWALAEIGTDEAVAAIERALSSATADTRAQALRALGTLGRGNPWRVALLADPDPAVRRQAAAAVGRLGEPALSVTLLLALRRESELADPDPFVAFSLRHALRELGDWPTIAGHLVGASPAFTEQLALTLREVYEPALVRALARVARGAESGRARACAIGVLAEAHARAEPWDGTWWSIQPAATGHPAKVLEWEGTGAVLAAVRAALDDPEPEVRLAAVAAVREAGDLASAPALRGLFAREADSGVRLELLDVLGELRDPDCVDLCAAVVTDGEADVAVRTAAVAVLRRVATPEAVGALVSAAGSEGLDTELVVASVRALGRMRAEVARPLFESLLTADDATVREASVTSFAAAVGPASVERLATSAGDPDADVRRAVAEALGELGDPSGLPVLLALADDPDVREDALAALARRPDRRALTAYLAGLEEESSLLRRACRRALAAVRDEVRREVEELWVRREIPSSILPDLQRVYSEPRALRDWTVCGPFPDVDGGDAPEASAPPHEAARAAGRIVRGEGPHGRVDLVPLFEASTNTGVLAVTPLSVEAARSAEVSVGSDDQVKVWLDGELVHEFGGTRGWSAGSDRFQVELTPGEHELALWVHNVGGGWAFSVAVSEPVGGPLFEEPIEALTLEDYRRFALDNPGDAARGAELFGSEAGPGCSRCHAVGENGEGGVGPDLAGIGSRYTRAELIRSVLEPSARIQDGYRATFVELASGEPLLGIVRAEEEGELVLVDTQGNERRIPLSEVAFREESALSAMPNGLETGLTPEEFADLIAYVVGLRQ